MQSTSVAVNHYPTATANPPTSPESILRRGLRPNEVFPMKSVDNLSGRMKCRNDQAQKAPRDCALRLGRVKSGRATFLLGAEAAGRSGGLHGQGERAGGEVRKRLRSDAESALETE
jgi:hypothetical protein